MKSIITKNTIWFTTPKAANSSIYWALKLWNGEVPDPATNLHGGWKTLEPKEIQFYPNLLKIACVRNPFDRLVSCWQQKLQETGQSSIPKMEGFYHGMPFDEFVEAICNTPDDKCDHHFKPQFMHTMYKGAPLWNYLLKFETLGTQWGDLQKRLKGLPDLPHRNASEHDHYSKYYTNELVNKVFQKYADDCNIFNYGFEIG